MIKLHYFEHSRAHRVLWFLEELGVPYQVARHYRDPKSKLAPAEAKNIHPLGKFPMLEDEGHTMAESAVILEYLARTYGEPYWVISPGETDYWNFQYWMHYAEGSLMPPLIIKLVFSMLKAEAVPAFIRPLSRRIAQHVDKVFTDPQIKTHFRFVEQCLEEREWFAGKRMTICDIQMQFPMEAAIARRTIRASDYPAIKAYVEKNQKRPAYERALAIAKNYDFGPI